MSSVFSIQFSAAASAMLAALVKHVMFAIFAALRAKLIFFLTRRRKDAKSTR